MPTTWPPETRRVRNRWLFMPRRTARQSGPRTDKSLDAWKPLRRWCDITFAISKQCTPDHFWDTPAISSRKELARARKLMAGSQRQQSLYHTQEIRQKPSLIKALAARTYQNNMVRVLKQVEYKLPSDLQHVFTISEVPRSSYTTSEIISDGI